MDAVIDTTMAIKATEMTGGQWGVLYVMIFAVTVFYMSAGNQK